MAERPLPKRSGGVLHVDRLFKDPGLFSLHVDRLFKDPGLFSLHVDRLFKDPGLFSLFKIVACTLVPYSGLYDVK